MLSHLPAEISPLTFLTLRSFRAAHSIVDATARFTESF